MHWFSGCARSLNFRAALRLASSVLGTKISGRELWLWRRNSGEGQSPARRYGVTPVWPCIGLKTASLDMSSPSDDQIRARAHQLWELAGKPEGWDDEFWREA